MVNTSKSHSHNALMEQVDDARAFDSNCTHRVPERCCVGLQLIDYKAIIQLPGTLQNRNRSEKTDVPRAELLSTIQIEDPEKIKRNEKCETR